MTVEQADDINTLFISYEDSIKALNEKIWRMGYDVRFANKQIEALDGTLFETKTALNQRDTLIINYKREIQRVEKLEWIDKKARIRVGIGLAGVALGWIALFLLSK